MLPVWLAMAKRLLVGAVACAAVMVVSSRVAAVERDASLEAILRFERGEPDGFPAPWMGGPRETIRIDTTEVHGGKASARVERSADSANHFSTLTLSVPIDFVGERLELRGFIRTNDVEGFAGLWMRQDGAMPNLAFDNMQRRQLRGTTPWTEHTISLPVHAEGKTLYFGFLLSGTGTAWVDDMQLLVDGKPIWTTPTAPLPETVLDRDHEFDVGSGIAPGSLSAEQVENLATLGRVWGLLKYHHPVVTQGQRHWDYELFRVMPSILAAADAAAADTVLLDWINSLGPVARRKPEAPTPAGDVHLPPDSRWIDTLASRSPALAEALRRVQAEGPTGQPQFYVSLAAGVKNPIFAHELPYREITGIDAGYQLLSLFRFWNIIQYWFPYRDLVDDWDAVLSEFIPRLALATDPDVFDLEMMTVIARVGDTHANLWSSTRVRPPVGEARVPVAMRFIGGEAVVAETLDAAGDDLANLRRGDVVLAIDGERVDELVRRWTPYYAASNQPTRLRDMGRMLLRGPAGPVRLGIRRAGEPADLVVERVAGSADRSLGVTHDLPGPAFRLLSPQVAYLKLSDVKQADVPGYLRQAAATKGWILDLRNYPSDFVVFALGSHLVERETPFARFTRADLARPGLFAFDDGVALRPKKPRYAGRIVILVDEISQSSSEYHAMAFRAVPGAIVVGSTTAGADGNASHIALPGGRRSMISGIGVFYPDKRPTQQVGIVPDIEARPTVEGIRDGRDEVLEVALRQILGPAVSEDEIRRLASPRE